MFSWVKSLFHRRGFGSDYYSPGERFIFTFFDGTITRKADPLPLYAKILARRQVLYADLRTAESAAAADSKFALMAHSNVIKSIREIFDLKPFEQGGLTERECLDLFNHFIVYVERVKKNSPAPPTTPIPTESASDSEEATNSISDSGSTASESTSAAPTLSPSVSPSP